MKAQANRELFTEHTFDSGALGVMASVVHPFPHPGRYQAQVQRGDLVLGSFSFVVDESAEALQLDVDLATVLTPGLAAVQGCGCHPDTPKTVSPRGHVLFHASTGTGYSVRVGREEGEEVSFDSRHLGEGDLFALCLLEPTRYSVVDRIAGARGEIVVSFSPEDGKRLKSLATVYVEAGGPRFEPAEIRLISTQGLVFRVHGRSRIVVEKTGQAEAPVSGRQPVRSWQKSRQESRQESR